jgi:uncharacterized membrane protein
VGSEARDGDVHDQPAAVSPGSDTGRLETFADSVMAIAITLLILDVRVPVLLHGESLAHALGHAWPSYASYATSFLVIGIIWVNHHRMFKLIERTDHAFLMINVVFLMVVSFIPFPTALVAAALSASGGTLSAHVEGVRTATFVYGGTMVALA